MTLSAPTTAPPVLARGVRIVIVVEYLVVGGAERQALVLAEGLRRTYGAEIEVWALYPDGRLTELCDARGFPWRVALVTARPGTPLYWAQLARLALRLRRARPDVLLPYTTPPNVACSLVWRLTGARACVWNQRDLGLHDYPPWLERLALRSSNALVANSAAGAHHLVRVLHAPAEQVHVVENGVALAPAVASRAEWRARIGAGETDLVACMVAHLHGAKDHETVVRAWQIVHRQWAGTERRAILALAGRQDSTHERLTTLARELGIADMVVLLGDVGDVGGLLSAVDLGVFSSRSEGSPNGLLECMAARLPVVAADIAPVRDAVPPEAVPFLFSPGDAEALGQRVVTLLADDALRRTVGAACGRRIDERFRPELMCEAMAGLIARAMRRR